MTLRFLTTLLLGAISPEQVREATLAVQRQASRLSARPVAAVSAVLEGVWPKLPGKAHQRLALCLSLVTSLLEVRKLF